MKKILLFGSLFTVFLMLMIPIHPAIQLNHSSVDYLMEQKANKKNIFPQHSSEPLINSMGDSINDSEFYALIVGCRNYEHRSFTFLGANLKPLFGLKLIYNELIKAPNWKQENIITLFNEQATKTAIADTIDQLSTQIDENDVFFFSWNGHGSTIPDDNGDEIDGLDEVICPYDTDYENGELINIITDDEFESLLSSIKSKSQFIFFESCYSGGMAEENNRSINNFLDVNKNGRVVVMSTPPQKAGYGDLFVFSPVSLLFAKAFSNVSCDYNHDNWISVEEAFKQVDGKYLVWEYNHIVELIKTIYPLVFCLDLLFINFILKIIGFQKKARLLILIPVMILRSCIVRQQGFIDKMYDFNMRYLDMRNAKNDPNINDGYPGELPFIQLS